MGRCGETHRKGPREHNPTVRYLEPCLVLQRRRVVKFKELKFGGYLSVGILLYPAGVMDIVNYSSHWHNIKLYLPV